MRKLTVAAVTLLALSSCALLKSLLAETFETPTLRFVSANLRSVTLGSAGLDLNFELANPNPVAVSLASANFKLAVEGNPVIAGGPRRGLKIPASGKTQFTINTDLQFSQLAPVLETFLSKDVAHYRLDGDIGLDSPIGVVTLPLTHEGTFDVPKLPNIQVGTPRISRLTFDSATIEIPLNVTNRSTYDLPIAGVTGAFQLAGTDVGTLSTGELGILAARQTREVRLPLTIHFLRAASAALALQRGTATVGFNGQVSSGPAVLPIRFSQNVAFQR